MFEEEEGLRYRFREAGSENTDTWSTAPPWQIPDSRFSGEVTTDWSGLLFSLGGGTRIIDELVVHDFGSAGENAVKQAQETAHRRWDDGRYYKWNDAEFVSVPVSLGGGRIRHLSWTLLSSSQIPEGDVTVRITGATAGTEELSNEAGTLLELPTWGPVRYRVRFRPTPQWDEETRLNRGIYESPVFDDITIVYELPVGAAVFLYDEESLEDN